MKSVTRTRERSDGRVRTGSITYYTRSGLGPFHTPDFDYYTFTNYEKIIDEVHKRPSGGRYPIGPCHHVRITTALSPVARYESRQFNGDWDIIPINSFPPLNPTMVTDFVDFLPSTTITSLGFRAFESMNSQIPSPTNILNFVWELKDIKELLPNVLEKKGGIGRANDAYLNANFGWKPLVGDLAKLSKIIDRINDRLKFLRSTRDQTVRVHFKVKDAWVDPKVNTIVNMMPFSPYTVPDSNYHWKLLKHDTTFRASGWLYQKLDGLDDAMATWKALWADLGLNNPAKAIWNAYPYSFVADWFFPVDNWLSTKGAQPFTGEWSLSNVVHSLTEEVEIQVYHTNLAYDDYRRYNNVGKIFMTRYTRLPGLPVAFDDAMSLSTIQQSLLLSLATARTKIAK